MFNIHWIEPVVWNVYASSVHRDEYFNFEKSKWIAEKLKENHQKYERQVDDDDVEFCHYQNDSEIGEIHLN